MIGVAMTSEGEGVISTKICRKCNIKEGPRFCVKGRNNEVILKPIKAETYGKIPGIPPN